MNQPQALAALARCRQTAMEECSQIYLQPRLVHPKSTLLLKAIMAEPEVDPTPETEIDAEEKSGHTSRIHIFWPIR
ncbi:hypothetical protein EMGBS4_13840 [Acidimicrobiaceae bacterium]|nr:hypothetical protein EMGBS4_13840 [Acidimicrobiaceae bacterium]